MPYKTFIVALVSLQAQSDREFLGQRYLVASTAIPTERRLLSLVNAFRRLRKGISAAGFSHKTP